MLVTIFLDALSFGLIFPILPALVVQLSGGDASAAARTFGWMSAAWALANLFGAPVLGALSDRFGRRPVILISAAGFAIDLVVMALAPNLVWLFVGRALTGLTAAGYSAASAYISDITPADQRAKRFGIVGGVYGAGMILGPAVGGLLGGYSARAPFWVAAGLMAASWVYGVFVLPESLPRALRAKVDWSRANPLGSIGMLARRSGLLGLASVTLLIQLAANAANTLFILYTSVRYHWTPAENGLLLMAYSAGNILVMTMIAPRLVRRIGERRTLLLGLALCVIGYLGFGLAPNPLLFCLACLPACLGNMCGPALQALQTRWVEPTEYGRLQGALGAVVAVAGLVGPVVFTQIFAWSAGDVARGGPGLPLVLGGVMMVAGLCLAVLTARPPAPAASAA